MTADTPDPRPVSQPSELTAEPLTAPEEAVVRDKWRAPAVTANGLLIRRLLATLDAARAAREPSGLDFINDVTKYDERRREVAEMIEDADRQDDSPMGPDGLADALMEIALGWCRAGSRRLLGAPQADAGTCARCGERVSLNSDDGTCWPCSVKYRDEIIEEYRAASQLSEDGPADEGAGGLEPGFAGHGSHAPGRVCFECDRIGADQPWLRPTREDIEAMIENGEEE